MSAPKEPPHSCPNLDSAIAEIERARTIHDQLREWGNYYLTLSEERQDDIDRLSEERNRQYREYESQIEDLQSLLEDAREQIQELTRENNSQNR
jgi:chromosome segregation ATPase